MNLALGAAAFGILAAVSWGISDFIGGQLTKRFSSLVVIFGVEVFGIALMYIAALATKEPVAGSWDLILGGISGVLGMVAIITFFEGMSKYKIGLVVPLSAVISASLPMVAGALLEGLPGVLQTAGLVLAVVSIWIISGGEVDDDGAGNDEIKQILRYALLAGLGFGLFFIVMGQVSDGAVFWPIISARAVSLVLIGLYLLLRGDGGNKERLRLAPPILIVLFVAGLLDAGGNVFYLLAAQTGRLDISAVLTSLYPAVTVFLAWLVLKEKLTRRQLAGVIVAMVAVLMIAS